MRIAVIGPQNTGKSTFIEDFLHAFPSYSTPSDTYRDVVHEKGLLINQHTSEESQRAILEFLKTQAEQFKATDAIFDRCLIDNWVYTKYQHLKGKIKDEFVQETEGYLLDHLAQFDALVFIPTVTGVALVNDELRDIDRSFIDGVNRLFIDKLLALRSCISQPIVTVTGAREERVAIAKEALGL
jgi:hypothetical protein